MTDIVNKMIDYTSNGVISEKDAIGMITEYYYNNGLMDVLDRDILYYKIGTYVNKKDTFKLDFNYLKGIHYYLFNGIISTAGEIRNTNISKKEECLHFRSVIYSDYDMILDNINYDFEREKKNIYWRKGINERVQMLSIFISNIWQAHPFFDGNTRTDMVFLRKYLEYLDIYHNPLVFEENFSYFRNALVRSNYNTIGWINPTYEYLNKFIYNLLLGDTSKLDITETYVPEEQMIIRRR